MTYISKLFGEAQWLRAMLADEEFLGLNPTATALSGFPRHEMTSAVNVALTKSIQDNHRVTNDDGWEVIYEVSFGTIVFDLERSNQIIDG